MSDVQTLGGGTARCDRDIRYLQTNRYRAGIMVVVT